MSKLVVSSGLLSHNDSVGNIPEFVQSDKAGRLLTTALILLVGIASYGLGRLSALEGSGGPANEASAIRINNWGEGPVGTSSREEIVPDEVQGGVIANEAYPDGRYVGSKNGTVYHYPWCSGAQRINEENKVWFATAELAAAAGYRPAKNCAGL